MNPRMDEVYAAVRRAFPLGRGWLLTLVKVSDAIAVTLDNTRTGRFLTFAVAADSDPAAAVAIAADRETARERAAA